MYKTLLLDFDGTLVPTLDFYLDGFKYAFDKLGVPQPAESMIIENCFYRNDEEIAETFNLGSTKSFWSFVTESLAGSFAAPDLFPGVKEVLEHCREKQIPMGLVTSSDKSFVSKIMKGLDISHHFSVIVTGDDIENYKPHPEPVLKALAGLHAAPENALFVGDYIVDVYAGKAAGTDTAVFFHESHGKFHKYEHLKSSEPNFIFSDYRELLAKL